MSNAIKKIMLAAGPDTLPTLVFVPGAICPPEIFSEVARLSGCRSFGLPWLEGDGPHDMVSVARRVIDALAGLGPVVLIGHSVGTAIAVLAAEIDLASEKPAIVGLVLGNSGANTKGHGDIDAVFHKIATQWGPVFWDAFVQRCISNPVPDSVIGLMKAYPPMIRPESVVEVLRSQQAIDLVPVLPRLAGLPVAVVHGRKDPARTLTHAEEFVLHVPGAQLFVMDTGHSSAVEAPREFAAVVRAVIDGIGPI
ncbi:MAG: alpha/beta hydrolase [Pseudomonadota bacterium]